MAQRARVQSCRPPEAHPVLGLVPVVLVRERLGVPVDVEPAVADLHLLQDAPGLGVGLDSNGCWRSSPRQEVEGKWSEHASPTTSLQKEKVGLKIGAPGETGRGGVGPPMARMGRIGPPQPPTHPWSFRDSCSARGHSPPTAMTP